MTGKIPPVKFSRLAFFAGITSWLFLAAGCFSSDFTPTYKESAIPASIEKICNEEYDLSVVPARVGNTLWVYCPQERILHKDFGKDPEKLLDEQLMEKARKILTGITRVLLSSHNPPEFYVLVFSDINVGLYYSLTANLTDLKKASNGSMPVEESMRRYVMGFERDLGAVGDIRGKHLKVYDIKMPEFLARQIVQRFRFLFQEERMKKYFTLKDVNAGFEGKIFTFEYSVDNIKNPEENIDIPAKIADIAAKCFRSYEFGDFSGVTIKDLSSGKSLVYSKEDIASRAND